MFPSNPKPENSQIDPSRVSPEELSGACEPFKQTHQKYITKDVVSVIEFGEPLAEAVMLDVAIDRGFEEFPEFEGSSDLIKTQIARTDLADIALKKCVECPLYEKCLAARELRHESSLIESKEELEKRKLLLNLATRLTKQFKKVVVKGGMAAVLYGADRLTGDIDLDTSSPMSTTERTILDTIVTDTAKLGERVKRIADTDTIQRRKIPFLREDGTKGKPIKVEIKTKQEVNSDTISINEVDDITYIDGVRVYTPSRLLREKLDTISHRNKPRDVFDIAFFMSTFPEAIKDAKTELLEKALASVRSFTITEELEGMPRWVAEKPKLFSQMLGQVETGIIFELAGRQHNS